MVFFKNIYGVLLNKNILHLIDGNKANKTPI